MSKLKFFFSIFLILTLCLTITTTSWAGGYELAGVGAKALAMAGAFRGIADDWSAMYWNPAGLAGQDNSIYADLKIIYPMVWVTPNVSSAYPGYEGYRNGVEHTTKEKAFPAGSFGITFQHSEAVTFGFSVYAPAAISAEWKGLFTGPPYGYNNTEPYPEKGWFSDLSVIDFHPSVGYQVNDQLSVGLGISVQYGIVELTTPNIVPSGAPYPFEHFYVDATFDGSGTGYGFNIGMLYQLADDMNFGISYRGPVTIAIEGKIKQNLILPYAPGIGQADPTKAHLFNGGNIIAEPDATADFPLPMDLGVGIAYQATSDLTVAFDVTWTNWEDVDVVTIEIDGDGPTGEPAEDSELVLKYEDTIKFSFGFDMLVKAEHDFHVVGGYYFDPSPIPDGSLRPSITDVNDKHNISLGFSHALRHGFLIQGYYERVISDSRNVESMDIDGNGSIDNLAGEWKMQIDTFGFTLGYNF